MCYHVFVSPRVELNYWRHTSELKCSIDIVQIVIQGGEENAFCEYVLQIE